MERHPPPTDPRSVLPGRDLDLEVVVRQGKGTVREIEEFTEEITIEQLTEEVFVKGSDWFPKPSVVLFDKY